MTQPATYSNRRFLITLLGGMAVLLVPVALFNFVVDPYASFRWSDIKGFNDQKTLRRGGGRVNKALILGHTRFDVLFYGTSRGEMGLDPHSPVLAGASAFNASLSSTNMAELARAAEYASRHQSPELVVVGLDLLMFDRQTRTNADFGQSGFADAPVWPIYVRRLLSMEATSDSGWVLFTSRRRIPQSFAKDGSYDIGVRKRDFDHRAEMDGVLRAQMALPGRHNTYGGFVYAPERMADLKRFLAAFDNGKTRVLLFVTPLHAKVLEAKTAAGLQSTWEHWKRELVATVESANTASRRPAELWDFSGYNAITTEPIPSLPGQAMRWYWDGSHFTKAAGNLILERMLSGKGDNTFGVRLSPDSIEADIARIRAERALYAEAHAGDVADIDALAARTGIGAP